MRRTGCEARGAEHVESDTRSPARGALHTLLGLPCLARVGCACGGRQLFVMSLRWWPDGVMAVVVCAGVVDSTTGVCSPILRIGLALRATRCGS